MAEIVETIERDGKLVNVYANGMEREKATGYIVKGPTATQITAQNATLYHRARQEKQSRLLRAAIQREHNAKMTPVANGSAAAFAESGALLYSEVVLNAEAYPRDRMEAWEKLGKYAQVLADPRDKGDAPTAGNVADNIANLTALIELVREVVLPRADVVEGKVNE